LPLPIPNLDDRAWTDLVAEGRALIPAWAPEWTNHNPSDPGITLVELFAYLSEILIYRLNRVGDENLIEFLKLINGPAWKFEGDLELAKQSSLRAHSEIHRAVTARDFEQLALSVNETANPAAGKIARVKCIPGRNLPAEWEGSVARPTAEDVSVVVLAENPSSENVGEPEHELLRQVRNVLDRAQLLCTRVHVLAPRYVTIGVRARLAILRNVHADAIHTTAVQALDRFFDPLQGGPENRGWPFGRDVYLSELYQLLANLDGVDEVREVVVTPVEQKRELRNDFDEVEAIDLGPGELVKAHIAPGDIMIEPQERYAHRD